jgi:hypothetical protein
MELVSYEWPVQKKPPQLLAPYNVSRAWPYQAVTRRSVTAKAWFRSQFG